MSFAKKLLKGICMTFAVAVGTVIYVALLLAYAIFTAACLVVSGVSLLWATVALVTWTLTHDAGIWYSMLHALTWFVVFGALGSIGMIAQAFVGFDRQPPRPAYPHGQNLRLHQNPVRQ